MRAVPILGLAVAAALAACGGGAGGSGDDDGGADAASADGAVPDAVAPDGAPDGATGVPLAGFGTIEGSCGAIGDDELAGGVPLWFASVLTFADRYDDPEDRDQLTDGGEEILLAGNAGGSSLYSEVFAFEVLHRCELAALLATENEIVYSTPDSKKADLLVEIDGVPLGVSVTRAVTYPFGEPYTLDAATTLLDRKLDDILLARDAATEPYTWTKSMVVALAYDEQHAEILSQAWEALDAPTRADSLVVVVVTSGDDLFIYTDQ